MDVKEVQRQQRADGVNHSRQVSCDDNMLARGTLFRSLCRWKVAIADEELDAMANDAQR